jgi:two-component system, NarL family, response regulator DesR
MALRARRTMLSPMASGLETRHRGVTCLLADDNGPVLEALASLLRTEGIDVVGEARTGVEALELMGQQPARVVVLDVRLPDLSGFEVARRSAEIVRKQTSIIFYTSYADAKMVSEALDLGARGVVLKDAPPENLLHAIDAVSAGGVYVDPKLRRAVWRQGR